MEQSQALRAQLLTEKLSLRSLSLYPSVISRPFVEYAVSWGTWLSRLMPILVILKLGYAFYVYCYLFSWKWVMVSQSQRLGITFMAVFCGLASLVLLTWSQVLFQGPGSVNRVPQYDLGSVTQPPVKQESMSVEDEEEFYGISIPPRIFACDSHGFPLWCSTCQSVKPDRSHHSAELGRCIPKMDHFCTWMGGIVGLSNYRPFFQFVCYLTLLLIFVLVSLAMFVRTHGRTIHFILLYVLAGGWLVMLSGFLLSHVRYILSNTTTIEQLKMNRNDFPIYNFEAPDGLRVVSRMRRNDPMPYDLGRFENWKLTMGPTIIHWILPVKVHANRHGKSSLQGCSFNPKLFALFEHRYQSGEDGYLAYPHLQTIHEKSNSFGPQRQSTLRSVSSRQCLKQDV